MPVESELLIASLAHSSGVLSNTGTTSGIVSEGISGCIIGISGCGATISCAVT